MEKKEKKRHFSAAGAQCDKLSQAYLQVAQGARVFTRPRAVNLVVRAHERAHTGLNGAHERLVVYFKFDAVSHVCGDVGAVYLLVVVDEVLQEKIRKGNAGVW